MYLILLTKNNKLTQTTLQQQAWRLVEQPSREHQEAHRRVWASSKMSPWKLG